MSINPIKPPKGAVKKRKIVGRGDSSGHGSTCGRGDKGQKSRSGGGVRPGFEGGQMPLYRRVARRGFSNYPFKKVSTPVNIEVLENHYANGETVDLSTLKEKKIVKQNVKYVKILGNGELSKKLTVDGLKVSKHAQELIEKAGGSVVKPEAAESEGKEPSKKKEDKETNDKEGQE